MAGCFLRSVLLCLARPPGPLPLPFLPEFSPSFLAVFLHRPFYLFLALPLLGILLVHCLDICCLVFVLSFLAVLVFSAMLGRRISNPIRSCRGYLPRGPHSRRRTCSAWIWGRG